MTSKGDREHGYDRTRGNVALAKLGNALGVKLDPDQPDHVLLEQLARAAGQLQIAYLSCYAQTQAFARAGMRAPDNGGHTNDPDAAG